MIEEDKKRVRVVFPKDDRGVFLKYFLFDGKEHEIVVDEVRYFEIGGRQFYEINGLDRTKVSGVGLLLMEDENKTLKNVSLFDYTELRKYDKSSRPLVPLEVDMFLEKYGNYYLSTPISFIADVFDEERFKAKKAISTKPEMFVLFDYDGKKYISEAAAKSLEYNPTKHVEYLPIKNSISIYTKYGIDCSMGFRYLSEKEFYDIMDKYNVTPINIEKVKVINHEFEFYVSSDIFVGCHFGIPHAFYDFSGEKGSEFSKYVKINKDQYKFLVNYYTVDNQHISNAPTLTGDLSRIEPDRWTLKGAEEEKEKLLKALYEKIAKTISKPEEAKKSSPELTKFKTLDEETAKRYAKLVDDSDKILKDFDTPFFDDDVKKPYKIDDVVPPTEFYPKHYIGFKPRPVDDDDRTKEDDKRDKLMKDLREAAEKAMKDYRESSEKMKKYWEDLKDVTGDSLLTGSYDPLVPRFHTPDKSVYKVVSKKDPVINKIYVEVPRGTEPAILRIKYDKLRSELDTTIGTDTEIVFVDDKMNKLEMGPKIDGDILDRFKAVHFDYDSKVDRELLRERLKKLRDELEEAKASIDERKKL